MRAFVVLSLLVVSSAPAAADPIVLRLSSVAPEGTLWARELKAFGREVSSATHDAVSIKWYLSGIAGDELQSHERVRRDQLDGIVSGGMLCQRLSPSMRVLRMVGLFQTRAESGYVAGRLKALFDEDFRKQGFVNLGDIGIGPDLFFSREPIRSMEDFKRQRLWIWSLDPVWTAEMKALGVNAVPLPVEEAGRAYDEGRIDGFLALPNAALAFQWAAKTRYFSNLTLASMASCLLISSTAIESLPFESQAALRAAANKATLHFEDVSTAQEDALVGGLFERQGTQRVDASVGFRAAFLETARVAREALPESIVPRALITKVLGWLSDFRAERP
jgi:TRAP-type transport system periplasmic protein